MPRVGVEQGLVTTLEIQVRRHVNAVQPLETEFAYLHLILEHDSGNILAVEPDRAAAQVMDLHPTVVPRCSRVDC